MKPGELINLAFMRQFGPQQPEASSPAPAAPPSLSPEAASQLEKLEKIAVQQALTEHQTAPPIGAADVAVLLAALRSLGSFQQGSV